MIILALCCVSLARRIVQIADRLIVDPAAHSHSGCYQQQSDQQGAEEFVRSHFKPPRIYVPTPQTHHD
jgi:hypothetical protein